MRTVAVFPRPTTVTGSTIEYARPACGPTTTVSKAPVLCRWGTGDDTAMVASVVRVLDSSSVHSDRLSLEVFCTAVGDGGVDRTAVAASSFTIGGFALGVSSGMSGDGSRNSELGSVEGTILPPKPRRRKGNPTTVGRHRAGRSS